MWYNEFGDYMKIPEAVLEIATKICNLYPELDREQYFKAIAEMKIVESDDITDKKPVTYHAPTNTLKLNVEEINKGLYDVQYYMTVVLLAMTQPSAPELDGLRYGYYSGVASNLVGNFTKETATEVEPGVDIYESLRDCISRLSDKIGPETATRLCLAPNASIFSEMYVGIGLGDPEKFLNQLNYLFSGAIIDPKKTNSIVSEIDAAVNKPEKAIIL